MFFFLLFLLPHTLLAAEFTEATLTPEEENKIQILSQTPAWTKLLHYTPKWLGGFKGRADGKDFYFARDGKSNPENEMRQSLLALKENRGGLGFLKTPFPCAFPARTDFLKRHFVVEGPPPECKDFEAFYKGMNPQGLSIIFASNYAQSSASYFGHTFLRVNSGAQEDQKHQDIMDYTFGFSAMIAPEASVWSVAVNSLYGNVPGAFDISPYYLKVKEYNHSEARDIWEYELDVTAQEAGMFVKHLWELGGSTYFDYYFLDENCAYFILALLEAIRPEWNLINQFPIYVIPGETVKALKKVGAIKSVKLRPSIRRTMLQREAVLTNAQVKEFELIKEGKKNVEEENDPLVLEMLSSYLSFRKFGQQDKFAESEEKIFNATLARQSDLPTVDEAIYPPIVVRSRPDESHHTFNLGASVGQSLGTGLKHKSETFTELSFKPAVHDLLNRDIGFNPNSQTDYLKVLLRYYPLSKRFDVDEVLFMAMMTLIPRTRIDKGLSWGVSAGLYTPRDFCYKCKAIYTEGVVGASWNYWGERLSTYVLPLVYVQGSSAFENTVRAGPGLSLGFILNAVDQHKLQVQAKTRFDFFQKQRQRYFTIFEANQSWAFSQSFDARLSLSHGQRSSRLGRNYQEAKFNFNYYY